LNEQDAAAERVDALPWPSILGALETNGVAQVERLLSPAQCADAVRLWDEPPLFRSTVVMARHGYGSGQYRYFDYPLPPLVARLRQAMYPWLVPLANRWYEALGLPARFPNDHGAFVARCHAAGQLRPTPLLLRYEQGDYNRLHQDLYGEHVFPLQLVVLLSRPAVDFAGGELVLTEQRARMQSRAIVLTPQQGDAVIFAVRERPVPSKRGHARAQMRHGVSNVTRGLRYTLGVIFHDAN
jgi:hypothetical protein